MARPEPSASIVVPATTANVGCAFDCAGIALGLYLRASATASDSGGFEVTYSGENADQIPRDANNLIVKAMQRAAARSKMSLTGARVDVQNDIPLGVGLGSSGAAIVAGTLLGAELCGLELDAAETLRMALELEGHPDNIAAAVHGGMVVAATTSTSKAAAEPVEVLVARVDVSPKLDFVAVIPEVPLPTEKARAALPAEYSRADVVANLQRTALLTACFFSGQRLSTELFRDRLHQPYRAPLVPGLQQCLDFRHPGLVGIFLSGAGSAVMAVAEHSASRIGESLVAEFRRRGTAARILLLKADNHGAQVTNSSGMRALGPAVATPTPRA
jgi:homoserine kinase